MGFDVHGRAPSSEVGTYFRNNVWYWRPLANYISEVAPSLYTDKVWQYNDGKGLNAADAAKLALILETELKSGNTAAYAINYLRRIQSLPDEECKHCSGSGKRDDEYVKGTCNACEGKGHHRPFETWYSFEVENIQAFTAFVAASGGFEIW